MMFVILATLFVYMALPLGKARVDAVGGVMDLRGHDLSDAVFQLTGEWKYTSRQLISPGDFPDNAPITVIPEQWPKTFDDLNTYATYRLTIITDDTRSLTMFIPEIYMAFMMWINGDFVRGAGVVADNQKDSEPVFESSIVPVIAEDGRIEIVIQGSNFFYMRPIMNSVILLGENDAAFSWFFRTRALYMIALGLFIAGAFYHFAVFALHREDKIYLLYALLSLVCFWRYAVDTNGLSNLAGWFAMPGGLADIKAFMMLFFLHGAAIAAFSMYVFDKDWMSKHRFLVIGYAVFGTALYGIIPWNTQYAAVIVIGTMAPAVLLVLYRAVRSRKLREDKTMWLYFAAIVIYAVVSFIQKYFFDHLLYMTGMIGDLFLLMIQALILSRQFAQKHESERLLGGKNEMLDRLNRMKTVFLQNMSHDFKTPLTVISTQVQSVSDMLDFNLEPEDIRDSMDTAQREVMLLSRMVDGAMKQTMMHDGQHDMEMIDFASLLRYECQIYHAMLERKGNTIAINIPEKLPPVYGNNDMLLHILSNLISNANKHTRNGRITLTAVESNGVICVTVRDNGTGITPEMLPHVFERGVTDGGTGLGLSICKSAIESHGGTISVASEYGNGTSVTFTLPVYNDPEEEDQLYER